MKTAFGLHLLPLPIFFLLSCGPPAPIIPVNDEAIIVLISGQSEFPVDITWDIHGETGTLSGFSLDISDLNPYEVTTKLVDILTFGSISISVANTTGGNLIDSGNLLAGYVHVFNTSFIEYSGAAWDPAVATGHLLVDSASNVFTIDSVLDVEPDGIDEIAIDDPLDQFVGGGAYQVYSSNQSRIDLQILRGNRPITPRNDYATDYQDVDLSFSALYQ